MSKRESHPECEHQTMAPSPETQGSDSGTLLCCGLCKIKMIKRNFFRGLFRLSRPHASVRKSDHESAECSRAYHRHGESGVRDALETDLRDKSYLGVSPVSPSVSVTTSGRSQCNVHCRKSSVLSFGDVDTREVHRMMKFINRSKVMLCLQQYHMRTSYHGQISSICKFTYKHFHKISFFLPSAKLIGEREDSTQYAQSPVQTTQITDRHST